MCIRFYIQVISLEYGYHRFAICNFKAYCYVVKDILQAFNSFAVKTKIKEIINVRTRFQ